RIAPTVNARVVTLDIERIPGQHSTWHRGQTITGPFWDLNEIKGWTGKRIHPDNVSDWPRTICAAWKWYDQPDTEFAAEWELGGHQASCAPSGTYSTAPTSSSGTAPSASTLSTSWADGPKWDSPHHPRTR